MEVNLPGLGQMLYATVPYCNIQSIQANLPTTCAKTFPWRGFLSAFLDFEVEAGTSYLCSPSVSALFPFPPPVLLRSSRWQ